MTETVPPCGHHTGPDTVEAATGAVWEAEQDLGVHLWQQGRPAQNERFCSVAKRVVSGLSGRFHRPLRGRRHVAPPTGRRTRISEGGFSSWSLGL